jgi:diguanylate cyclase (GGDEF)-like protein
MASFVWQRGRKSGVAVACRLQKRAAARLARDLLPAASIMKTVRATRSTIQQARQGRTQTWRSRSARNRTGSFPAVVPPAPAGEPPSKAEIIKDLQRENAKLRRALAELESYRHLAYRDTLTGLWNRRYFDERLGEEISMGSRDSWRRFSLLALDLNDLKRVNDLEGHAAGDLVLKRTASFLKSRLREHDVCCRTGGDEFAVILRELGSQETAKLVSRLRAELRALHGRRPNQLLSLAMGTASFPEDGSNARQLCLRADERMYEDKRRIKGLALAGEPMPSGKPQS